jgi:nitrogen-specific signal transduction histidine kinase
MFINIQTLDFDRYGRCTLINTDCIESATQAIGPGGAAHIVLRMRSGTTHTVPGAYYRLARVLDAQHPDIDYIEEVK